MIVNLRTGQFLSYEMNVHPGESVEEFRASLHRFTIPIRESVAPGKPFGIAPRVGRGLLRDLARSRTRLALRDELRAHALLPFTVNAFPLSDFHARRVKERVYAPPWTQRARATLTNRIADWLAEVLPDGERGTISTLGGSYRPWGNTPTDHRKMAAHYLATIAHLIRLRHQTSKTILLTVEPEPDTTFETAEDVVQFVEGFLRPELRARIARPLRLSMARAEEELHRHFAVNLDICHQSVLFREPLSEWSLLERAGLRVGKLHLTNALALKRPARSPKGLQALRAFDEPRYLHQFAIRCRDGSLVRGRDLPELGKKGVGVAAEEVRVHFHVPLSRARWGSLHTTREDTARALQHALTHPDPPQLVIETYTWPFLTRGSTAIRAGIVREFRWVVRRMFGPGPEPGGSVGAE